MISCAAGQSERGLHACENGVTHWDEYPLVVQYELDVSAEEKEGVAEAIDFWNAQSEVIVFVDFGDVLEGVAEVLVQNAVTGRPGESAVTIDGACEGHSATVTLLNSNTPGKMKRVAIHELGHVLGFEDDNDPYSIMHWRLVDGIEQHVPPAALNELRIIAASAQSPVVGVE